MQNKLETLEKHLKTLFSARWVSVRKAFLELDYDHDGFIDAEDVLRFFGGGSRFINCNDLEKIFYDIGTSDDGKITYNEFC